MRLTRSCGNASRGTPMARWASSARLPGDALSPGFEQRMRRVRDQQVLFAAALYETMSSGVFRGAELGDRPALELAAGLHIGERKVHDRRAGVAGQQAAVVVEGQEGADRRGRLVLAVRDVEDLQRPALLRPPNGNGMRRSVEANSSLDAPATISVPSTYARSVTVALRNGSRRDAQRGVPSGTLADPLVVPCRRGARRAARRRPRAHRRSHGAKARRLPAGAPQAARHRRCVTITRTAESPVPRITDR